MQPKPTTDPVATPKKEVAVEAKTVAKKPVEKEEKKVSTAVIEEKPA